MSRLVIAFLLIGWQLASLPGAVLSITQAHDLVEYTGQAMPEAAAEESETEPEPSLLPLAHAVPVQRPAHVGAGHVTDQTQAGHAPGCQRPPCFA